MTTDDRHLTERLQDAYRIEMADDVRRRQLDTITAALTAPPTVPVAPSSGRLRLRRRVAAVVAAVTVLSPAAMAVAAESSLPGDVLYPVKQVTEDIRSVVDPEIAARHRLDEADQMHAAGFPTEVVQEVLSDADEAIMGAGDPVDLRARWMDARSRMDVEYGDGEMLTAPPVDVDSSTSPMPGGSSGHDDRTADDTQRDTGQATDGSATVDDMGGVGGSDGGSRHDGAPAATSPASGTGDMGQGHDPSGTVNDGSGMGSDQEGTTNSESATSGNPSSTGMAHDTGTMGGSGSGSGG